MFFRRKMNFSQSSSVRREDECNGLLLKAFPMRYSSADSFHGFLIAAAALNLVTCPFTIFLNTLIVAAVKTKRRLQTHPNILLACLALTDLMVGLVVQPLHTAITILLLQGKDAQDFCDIHFAFTISFAIFIFATASHLILLSGERYLAIKYTFKHSTVVTKGRLMISSALVWITAPLYFIGTSYLTVARFAYHAALIFSIVSLQVLVYKEARRHEKMILSQQVSIVAKAKFKKEKKALKLTSIILAKTFLCFLLPSISVVIAFRLRDQFSPDFKIFVGYLCRLLVISSSVFNPVIYTVRKRQFRVACIELLLRKSLQDAEELDTRLFGSRAKAERPQIGRQGEEGREHTEHRSAAHAGNNLKHNPEVLASGGCYDETSLPLQNVTLSSDELTCPSESTREEHLAQDKNKHEDNPEVLAYDANWDEHSFSLSREPLSSNAATCPSESTREEHLAHDKNKKEDNPEVLASGANWHEHSSPLRREPFNSNVATHPSELTREEHDEERNPAHDKNKQNETPGLHISRDNPNENTFPLQKESLTLTDAFTYPSKSTREKHCAEGNPAHDKNKQEDNLEVNFPGSAVCLEPNWHRLERELRWTK